MQVVWGSERQGLGEANRRGEGHMLEQVVLDFKHEPEYRAAVKRFCYVLKPSSMRSTEEL